MFRIVPVLLFLAIVPRARADAPAPDARNAKAPPIGVTFSEFVLYGEGYSASAKDVTGWSLGGYASYDWSSDPSRKPAPYDWSPSLISELGIGIGSYAHAGERRIGFDFVADILGVGARLRLPLEVELAAFYEPIEILYIAANGISGSKLEFRAAWKEWQLAFARAGSRAFIGFVTAETGPMYTGALEWRRASAPDDNPYVFGLKVQSMPVDAKPGPTATSVMGYFGVWAN